MRRNLFTIAPGAPFLKTCVEAFLAGKIVESVTQASAPLALARATIYVPTQRAARALAAEFAQAFDGRATLLPRILPLGALEERENAALFSEDFDDADATLAPPIEELERRLLLAQLIVNWSRSVKRAIISVDPSGERLLHDSEPLLVASTPASAFTLAGDLGALIDEFAIENIPADAIKTLSDGNFDKYWAITTQFLGIAVEQWPFILAERGRVDAAYRQRRLVERQIEMLERQTAGAPVIALGSTGAHPTTARLLAAIAARENGAVVLPGLDQEIDNDAWARIGQPDGGDEPAFTHPQTLLKRLLAVMGAHRGEVRELATLSAPLAARRALISRAMLPAEATAIWRDYRTAEQEHFSGALEGVAIIEAPDERLEALALALFMREALETPERTAALVTPDRDVARRVAAELQRYGVDVDDSGGKSLASTNIGALARLVAAIGAEGLRAVTIAALLGQPLVTLGMSRARIAALAPLVEIGVLRAIGPGPSGYAPQIAPARLLAKNPHAHRAARRIDEAAWGEIEAVLTRIDAAFALFRALPKAPSLRQLTEAHRAALEALVGDDDAPAEEGASTLFELFARLECAEAPQEFDAASYVSMFDSIAFETVLRGPRRAHPRLKILGPLEARLIDADVILLAGLDEGVWPRQTDTGAFLNRSMRAQLGLAPPERRIGQAAHDFMMGLGAQRVVLSRALKRGGSPTVASRFLTRLLALSGDAASASKSKGARMLAIAAALDEPRETRSITRPAPRPPLSLRPKKLSVTAIERLRRDPYRIFAALVLKLTPLTPLGADPGPREIGDAIHNALEQFVRKFPTGPLPSNAREVLVTFAKRKLGAFMSDPAFVSFQWPRYETGLDHVLAFEKERRDMNAAIHVEIRGSMPLTLSDGSAFTLTAVADRIEVDRRGAAHVFDYKTGKPPTAKQVDAGWSPQLTLEAAMIEAGAFAEVGGRRAETAAYIAIGSGETVWLGSDKSPFVEMVVKHREELLKLLDQFRDVTTPYSSRPYVALMSSASEYDHLARVKEWSRGGDEA